MSRSYVVVGGAGFIGGHVVDRLLGADAIDRVTVFDNFTSGRRWHLEQHAHDDRLRVVEGDVKDLDGLCKAMIGHEAAIHLASNPDIARAATEPDIDFWEGTYLTNHVVEAVRLTDVSTLLYASGSGVYGDLGEFEALEDHGPLSPISTYGASKLAGEALIRSYCHMFGLRGRAFRFGNVVGPRQTHGVGFDFVRALLRDPTRLPVLGDGSQSKSYVHVDDVLDAVFAAEEAGVDGFEVYNVATRDYVTVSQIAELAIDVCGLDPRAVNIEYAGGSRGWSGDVPIVRLNTDRLRALGWSNRVGSAAALEAAMRSMVGDVQAGRM